MTYWFAWTVNDSGQIVGEGNSQGIFVGVIWTPLTNGKWKLTKLPAVSDYPNRNPSTLMTEGKSRAI